MSLKTTGDKILKNKYHFIAIGGVGMSGLAKYLLQKGFEVSGSDINDSKYVQNVKKLGAKVYIGHDENNLPDDCIVVASTAIRDTNPEIQKAKRLGLPIWHRSDLLAEISQNEEFFIGYSGTHGKTTTSGLSSYVLEKAGLKPSYVVGGTIPELNTNANCANDKFFIAELDESDGTIVKYSANVVVVNNLEPDHLDFYKNGLDSILETFEKFLSNIRENGIILANTDNEGVKRLVKYYTEHEIGHNAKFVTYSIGGNTDYCAKNITYGEEFTTFDILYKGEVQTNLKICLKGVHSVYNSLAVWASLHTSGVNMELVNPHFETFTGMGRRFQKIGEFDGITVYDDYAHHPTEIKATLSSSKSFKNRNVIAVFQPHRYSRLQNLWNEFMGAFSDVDRVIVTDVYAASEAPVDGVNSEIFTNELKEKIDIPCENITGSIQEVAKKLYPTLKSGDIVIGLGAGTITNLGKELLTLSEEKQKVVN
ncbi:MAG: UDP-N-acetylmuramate--L-alanine ligase [Muribaculaceae bacterium]|nr:UDP-N-acetylmuramate--L-alanine ligase [Muribaculaceae bacterium]